MGSVIASTINPQGRTEASDVTFPQIGTFTASPQCYCFGENTTYKGLVSGLTAGSKAQQGVKEYLRCSRSARCSNTTHSRGGGR